MRKFFAYPLTIIYYLFFGLILVVFHPIQWICFNLFGYQAHKKSVDALQFCLFHCLKFLGTSFTFHNLPNIPKSTPLIVVANHQSMYDITPMMWKLRKYHPKFISKKELGKGIPSVSYNLKHGGSVLIDRKNPKQSLMAIKNFAGYIERTKRTAIIFPEGTRSKTGQPKSFQKRGLLILLNEIPSAMVLPVTINNSWKMFRYGKFPLGIGNHLIFKFHQPLKNSDFPDNDKFIEELENIVTKDVFKPET
ncbi:lysophospholipid acyltransferase family protein [Aegicerativicinus sediminis]|uniref:lysophospholipid acyltransferase family protein n=1 Tax=Aegicerativicinus sediminis TaxID=2893202 RepID=UPI001E38305E|nr:lysophospholipid acyltransferase family protein [Aegicerativicinus sediminis]